MSEKPAPIYQFSDNGNGLKVSIGDTEALFLRDPDRELTVSITKCRSSIRSTNAKDPTDGVPTLLSHLWRIEAIGTLDKQKIALIDGESEIIEITEFPITIDQYDNDAAENLNIMRDSSRMLRGDVNITPKYYDQPHTAVFYFDPNDTQNAKLYPSTFLCVFVSANLMAELVDFIYKNKGADIRFNLKFENSYSQIETKNRKNISYSFFALCHNENCLYGNLTWFCLKSDEYGQSNNNDVRSYQEKVQQIDSYSNDLRSHQVSVQQNLQKIANNTSYLIYIICFIIFVIIFK
jgi:hypothetical protein